MDEPTIKTVSVVGTGVVGRSWIQVFIRAGCQARLYDKDPDQVEKALAWIEEDLEQDRKEGMISAEVMSARLSLISAHEQLSEALDGAGYVQESGPEILSEKNSIYTDINRAFNPDAMIGSSTSMLDITDITDGLEVAKRCIVAHPINPPHIIPLVEILAGKETDPEVITQAMEFLESVGQKPIRINFYIPGFVGTRIYAALLKEALSILESGAADVEAVDSAVRNGLGLRWALMGPVAVADANADGGVREYLTRFRHAAIDLMNNLSPTPSFSDDFIEELGKQTDAMVGDVPKDKIRRWRDKLIGKVIKFREENDPLGLTK